MTTPKIYVVDSGLLAYLLGADGSIDTTAPHTLVYESGETFAHTSAATAAPSSKVALLAS